jgi:recombinational DNA repair protein (RecF pathway)
MSQAPDAPEVRRCPCCGQVKPPSGFYRRRPGGPSGYCRLCQREVSRTARRRRMQDPASLAELRTRDRARKRRGRGGDAA